MILPNKHLKMYESLIYLSGIIIKYLKNPKYLEDIWQHINKLNNKKNKKYDTIYSFDKVVKSVDMLYVLGLVKINEYGMLERCD
ncbi:ABC-three component system middle component 6 [Brachyspira pilosicoli]|uniref:ABC-three component system middle component 6 n=1 Tax=Brachyspira pilosicoli TaxID=52584 RepID=UPI0012F4B67F|nr:ABC-three component system middle component 6 [Brachyspira pilosicoli]